MKLAVAGLPLGLLAAAMTLQSERSRAAEAGAAPVDILIVPSAMDEAKPRGTVTIAVSLPDTNAAAGTPLLGGVAGNNPGLDVEVTDDFGKVPAAPRGDVRGWAPARRVKGNVIVRYTLAFENSPTNGGIPPLGPRVDGRAFSSSGQSFLALPLLDKPRSVRLRWDLSRMGPGASAVSSFGEGDVTIPATLTGRIDRALFMAGQLKRVPSQVRQSGFSAVWSGDPGFDLYPVMLWTSTLYDRMNQFFGPFDTPYHVFLRYNTGNPGGGVAALNSFMVTYGKGIDGKGLEGIFGHEMTHTFTAFDMGIWFDEGNAVFYQGQLPWREHLISTQTYLNDINKTAARYYTNAKINTAESELLPNFWRDGWLNTLGYDRGAIYFAILNGKIRRASKGRRSIDDLMRVMVRRSRAGEEVNERVWMDLVGHEIGEEGLTVHRAMMKGETIVPDTGDYGPCFRRIVKKIRRYELGFTASERDGNRAVVKDLIAGSEAEKIGLRNGDRVELPIITSEGVRRDPEARITVQVTRDGRSFQVNYLPRGIAIDTYQWELRPDLPDNVCRPGEGNAA